MENETTNPILVGQPDASAPNTLLTRAEAGATTPVRAISLLAAASLLMVADEHHHRSCCCPSCVFSKINEHTVPVIRSSALPRGTFSDGSSHPNGCPCVPCSRWRKQSRYL